MRLAKYQWRICSYLFLVLSLSACVEQKVIVQIPSGYHPDPARELHQSLRKQFTQPHWQAIPDIPLTLQVADDKAFVANYFHARYPFLGLDSKNIDLFAAKHASQAFFEPKPSFADASYTQQIKSLQAQAKPLKQVLDDADIRFARDYMARAQHQQYDITGIVHFFHVEQRPLLENQQRVYGAFTHYQQPATESQNIEEKQTVKKRFMRVQALLYDLEQKLFYYRNAQDERFWLYALAHPADTSTSVWAGEQKVRFKGIKAKGGQCGRSVREWFVKHQNKNLPNWGYNHLGSGKVRYNKAGEPIAISRSLAFDQERAQNLIFEPHPPFTQKQMKNYEDRLTVLKAQRQSLLNGLDNLEIQPEKEYIGASRGAKILSHTGIVRFYKASERIKDVEKRTVYGEFIHNWNRKRHSGPMNINAIYYDAATGMFYWKNGEGHKKKMWIYGIATSIDSV